MYAPLLSVERRGRPKLYCPYVPTVDNGAGENFALRCSEVGR